MNKHDAEISTELRQRIEAFQREMFPKVPQAILASLQGNVEDLVKSGIAAQALKINDRAPDFTLPNVRGEPVSLSQILAQGPAVVAFYRGHW